MRNYDYKHRRRAVQSRVGVGFTEASPDPKKQIGVDVTRHFCDTLDQPEPGQKNHKRFF